ncbi:MAG: hypothetical protein HUJ70_14445 [Pseudobutyrivibrio sp.]|nr:hypothetical protein [Pseudobutyrivibrio sp.]
MAFPEKLLNDTNLVMIAVDKMSDEGFCGKIFHGYSKEATEFSDVNNMMVLLDEFYNTIGYPQSHNKLRRFKGVEEKAMITADISGAADTEGLTDIRGAVGSFAVDMESRQNTSWQGYAYWVEGDMTVSFQSDMELIKFIKMGTR